MGRFLYLLYIWLIFVPVMILLTVFFGIVCLLCIPVLGPRTVGRITAVPWSRAGLFLSGVKVDVYGREHIDPKQSYVIVANHLSHYDIWVLYGWLNMDIRWVMKQELRHVPVVGICCATLGHVFINRTNRESALASLNAAKKRISGGTSIIFFPEGTRSRDGHLREFKKGAFRMAQDLELPILPITLRGTRQILPPDTANVRPGRAQMVIQPPIPVTAGDEDVTTDLLDKSRAAIRVALEGQEQAPEKKDVA